MRFHFAGKYSGNPDDLPSIEHEPGAVSFKEAKAANELNKIMTAVSVSIFWPDSSSAGSGRRI